MTCPHGSRPAAAPRAMASSSMPAGKPSVELEEVLQHVLQGLGGGEDTKAAPRVAVLVDRPQPHLSNYLALTLGARERLHDAGEAGRAPRG